MRLFRRSYASCCRSGGFFRTDKLYNRLGDPVRELKGRGYRLVRIDELLKN